MMDRNDCGAVIKQIHDKLEKTANNALRAHGLTMAQISVLLALNDAGDRQLPLKKLEEISHVAQSTAAGIVSRLEKKGFVEAFGDSEDRRIKIVRITPEGIKRCEEAEQQMSRTEEYILSGLTEAEQVILITLLKKVRDTIY